MTAAPVLLLVDDEEKILTALERTLRREGYQLLKASSPAAALEILERTPVQAILSDHKMPGMTGVELLGEAARLQPDAARLLITGWTQSVPPEDLEQLHLTALLPKPWDDNTLKRALRHALTPS